MRTRCISRSIGRSRVGANSSRLRLRHSPARDVGSVPALLSSRRPGSSRKGSGLGIRDGRTSASRDWIHTCTRSDICEVRLGFCCVDKRNGSDRKPLFWEETAPFAENTDIWRKCCFVDGRDKYTGWSLQPSCWTSRQNARFRTDATVYWGSNFITFLDIAELLTYQLRHVISHHNSRVDPKCDGFNYEGAHLMNARCRVFRR